MSRDARFWRNVAIIGLAHTAILLGLIRWTREAKKPNPSDIIWMEGGAGDSGEVAASARSQPNESELTSQPTPEPSSVEEPEDQPSVAPVKSEIQLPAQTPTPTPVATTTPTPKPSVTPKSTPKPTPTATPKPKPKPTPKKALVAKATQTPTAKPKEMDDGDQTDDAEAKKKEIAKARLAKKEAADAEGGDSGSEVKKSTTAQGSGKIGSAGTGGRGSGAGGVSEFGWYGNMLHDRFYSEWVQPTTVVSSGARLSTLVKLRIEKDGRVSDFAVIKPSGNVVVDESVAAVAKRVTQVDPLPAGLGGQYYEVRINFELNSEE
jgi:TonB family protein